MRQKPSAFACTVLAALCLMGPAYAQLPRQPRLDTFSQIRHHLRTGRFARTVTVSPSGGDYTEPDAACTYVAGQTRSATATWLVLIYPGNYSTDCAGAPVATPTFTTLHRYDDLSPSLIDATDTPADEECWTWESTDGIGKVEFQPCGGAAGSPYNRTVVVDPSGAGDFLTVEEAVAYVAAQPGRSDTSRWIIDLQPGPNYTIAAAPLAVPTYTSIRGVIPHSIYPFWGQTRLLCPTLTSGTCLTMDTGSALVEVNVRSASATLVGALRVVEVIGSGVAFINVAVENNASAASQPVSLVETTTTAGVGFVMYYGYLTSLVNATNVTYLKHQNTGTVHIVDTLMRSSTGALAIIHNTSTGTISVLRSALGAFYSTDSDPNTCSLKNDSTGKIEPIQSSFWAPLCGTINDWHYITRVRTFVDTPPATCSPVPSEITLDIGTSKRLCVCVAANDWDCAALTP